MPPDPKRGPRVKDPELLAQLHVEWRGECAIADETCVYWTSIHHVHRHPRDDVRPNLTPLCGDGVRGHHGRIEAHEPTACEALYGVLTTARPDTMEYLAEKLGGPVAAQEWLRRHLWAAAA